MKLNYMRLSDHQLAEAIYREAVDDVTSILGRAWWTKNTNQKERALKNLLINLQVCGDYDDPFNEVAVSKTPEVYSKNNRYRECHFKYSIYVPLINALAKAGWCVEVLGWRDTRTNKGFLTRLLPVEGKITGLGLKDTYIDAPFSIELRDEHKDPIYPYEMTKYVDRADRNLVHYNNYLEQEMNLQYPEYPIGYSDSIGIVLLTGNPMYSRAHYPNDNSVTNCKITIPYANFRSRRIFNDGTWKHGGRHYNSIQNYSQTERKLFNINGLPTVELDFKALHPTMLYHMENLIPPSDCYSIFGDSRDAIAGELVKILMLTMINAETERAAIKSVQFKYNKDKIKPLEKRKLKNPFLEQILPKCKLDKLSDLAPKIRQAHMPIEKYFCKPTIGKKLQKADSEIMREILNRCVKENIPAIPIHDSVIVPAQHESKVIEIMQVAYFRKTGGSIIVQAK